MLNNTNPESLLKYKQADNCRTLQDILRGQIARGEPESNLDGFSNKCGTAFCLLGEYLKNRFIDQHQFDELCNIFDTKIEFGFGGIMNCFCSPKLPAVLEWAEVFGSSYRATRQQRIKTLDSHIERLEREAVECLT